MEVVYFVVLVGVLIFVHELGHFVWAKFFGVKVLKFSLGFGPKIAGFTRGGTEYVIAAFPLGGYVRMLGESPSDVVKEEDEGHAFSEQALWKRTIIVVAGPAMNLVLPIALFFVVFLGEKQTVPAVIGTVFPNRPADGALEPGDRVLRANGEEIATFYELANFIDDHPDEEVELQIERAGVRRTVRVTPEVETERGLLDLEKRVARIGIKPHHPLAVIGVTSPSSAAAAEGLRTFDRIVGTPVGPVRRWIDLERALADNPGVRVPIAVMRPVRVPNALDGLIDLEIYEPRAMMLGPEPGPGDGLARAGLEPADLYVSRVSFRSERSVDLRIGDRLHTLDDRPIRAWFTLLRDVEVTRDRVHELTWQRGDQLITRRYRLRAARAVTGEEYNERLLIVDPETEEHIATIAHWRPTTLDPSVPHPSPVLYAAENAWKKTIELVQITAMSIVRLFQGRLSVSTIGGPLRVFEETAAASREGTLNYLSLMAFISINLGLINLLPIPLLDGGHLFFIFAEAVSRRRISVRIRQYASLIGLVMLVGLMVLAFTNDIGRQWPRIVEAFQSE